MNRQTVKVAALIVGALLIAIGLSIEGVAKRVYFSGVDSVLAGSVALNHSAIGGATKGEPPKAVALFQVEYPKRMTIGDSQLVVAHVKITNLFGPLSDESSISLHSPAFEIAPTQPQAIPQATPGNSSLRGGFGGYFLDFGLQWAVSPKTMGNQVLLLDIPQVVWNPKRARGWFEPRPLMEVNGVRISDFNKQRLELKIQVTTLFGLSEISFKIIQYLLVVVGFILTYSLIIEYVKMKRFSRRKR